MDAVSPILSTEFINAYKSRPVPFGFNGLGYVVYKRTYSRTKEDGQSEEWYETVARCVNGAQKIGAGYTKEEAERLYDHVFNLRCCLSGRSLWQLGTAKVDRYGANSLINCFNISMNKPSAFQFLFENLMMGGGVGFSVRREDVHELPKVKIGVTVTHQRTNDADFIVPDSREGWVKLLGHVLDAFYTTGKSFTYSTILVRGAGEKIKGFGGTASGPDILTKGIDQIVKIFQGREEKKLRSIDVLDICNNIASIVVAGNIRRSATISLGDPDDYLFIRAKNWSLGTIPNWRSMSNNTIYADAFDHISPEIWANGYEIDPKTGKAKGEPYGFFNLPLSQRYGRLKDGPIKDSKMYPTDKDNCSGTNPCVAPETQLLTRDGYHIISELEGKEVEVWNGHEWSKTIVMKTGIHQRLIHLLFEREELDYDQVEDLWVTPYHRFYLNNGTLVEAKDLRDGDRLVTYKFPFKANGYEEDTGLKTFVVSLCPSEERYDDTYCINEPLRHKAVFNGVLTGQCGEISLASGESCNLAELYINNITSKDQLIDCARLLYKTQKAISAMPFLHEETNAVVHKNMRLGLGVTGVCQSLDKLDWLDDCYIALRKLDKEWSKARGWPESIKLTTVKPSGSLSLLAGATPGVHPAMFPFYIRRVRMASDDKLVKTCREAGYHVEFQKRFDGSDDRGTVVVEFPCQTPAGALMAKDVGVIRQLEMVKKLQTIWSDNAVSVTAYYEPEELTTLKDWLKENYETSIKSVSFLLRDHHGFSQAPYSEITETQYNELTSKIKPISSLGADIAGEMLSGAGECAGGACPIR